MLRLQGSVRGAVVAGGGANYQGAHVSGPALQGQHSPLLLMVYASSRCLVAACRCSAHQLPLPASAVARRWKGTAIPPSRATPQKPLAHGSQHCCPGNERHLFPTCRVLAVTPRAHGPQRCCPGSARLSLSHILCHEP